MDFLGFLKNLKNLGFFEAISSPGVSELHLTSVT